MASIFSSPGATKFGGDPALYDAARPAYPMELYAWLRETCGLSPESDCFEVGAGTGLASLPILATPIRSLLAIEPDTALAGHLRAAIDDPRLRLAIERFEALELPPQHFDFGFAATSFHWLPRMKSLGRVHAALKPGGYFAMWWHVFHDPANPDAFDAATAHLFTGLEQDPEATSKRPAFALDIASRLGEFRAAGFTDPRHRSFREEIAFTPGNLAALYATFSRVRMAPETTRTKLLAEVERTAREDFGGGVTRAVITSAFIARRD